MVAGSQLRARPSALVLLRGVALRPRAVLFLPGLVLRARLPAMLPPQSHQRVRVAGLGRGAMTHQKCSVKGLEVGNTTRFPHEPIPILLHRLLGGSLFADFEGISPLGLTETIAPPDIDLLRAQPPSAADRATALRRPRRRLSPLLRRGRVRPRRLRRNTQLQRAAPQPPRLEQLEECFVEQYRVVAGARALLRRMLVATIRRQRARVPVFLP